MERKLSPTLRRLLKWSLAGLLLVFLLLAAGYGVLTSSVGTQRVSKTLLESVNSGIQGRLKVGALEFSLTHLVLKDLVLLDPEGAPVAEVERVEAHFSLSPSQRKLEVTEALIHKPRLHLRKDERGLNLARAIQSKGTPTESPGGGEPAHFALKLASLLLTEGFVELTLSEQGKEQRFVAALGASASGSYSTATSALEGTLQLSGKLEEPSAKSFLLDAKVGGQGEGLDWSAGLELGEAVLRAKGKLQGTDKLEIALEKLTLPPELVREFSPEYPLKAAISATGKARLDGTEAALELSAEAGGATLLLNGGFDFSRLWARQLSVKVQGVDLSQLLEGGKRTELSLSLEAQGGGHSLEELEGSLRLEVPASTVEGQTLGPVRVRAQGKQGALVVEEVFARLPGAQVAASGSGSATQLEVTGKLSASSLETLSRTLAALVGAKAPPVSGHGMLALSASGPLSHPALSLTGTLPELRSGDIEVRALELDASLADIRRPLEARAKLHARSVRLGDRRAEDVRMSITSAGRRLSADFTSRGLADLLVHLGGTLEPGGQGAQMNGVAIHYPEAEWALVEPFSVRWAEGEFVLSRFALRSGKQLLSAQATQRGQKIDALLDAQHLSLSQLPKAFVPESLGLEGELSIKVSASGRVSHPAVGLELSWAGGAVGKVRQVDATLKAQFAKGRLEGTLKASAPLGRMEAELSIPVEKKSEPLQGTIHLSEVDLASASELLAQGPALRGTLRLDAKVAGSPAEPRVEAQLETGELSLRHEEEELPLLQRGTLTLSTPPEGGVAARVESQLAEGGRANFSLSTPLTVAKLLATKPSSLRTVPIQLSARVGGVELSWLAKLGVSTQGFSGRLDASLDAEGSADQPKGSAELALVGLHSDELPATDLNLSAQGKDAELTATLSASREGQRLVRLDARLGNSIASLLGSKDLENTPIELSASAGPLPVSQLKLAAGEEEERSAELTGTLQARLSGSGTLGAPTLRLFGSAEDLAMGKTPLGRVELDYRYERAHSTLAAKATSAGGGSMTLDAAAELELSIKAARRGLKVSEAPFEAKLKANHFDLRFLSGITQRVRLLEGELRADATARGTATNATFDGELEWTNGRVGLIGLGEYKKLHLLAKATKEKVAIEKFTARAGGGEVELEAVATRQREGYSLSAKGKLERFPVVYDDQLLAIATTRMTAQGELSSNRVNIRELAIPEARVELPEVDRKDLQDLDRPEDVVLVRNGQPLFAKKKEPQPDLSQAVASVDSGAAEGPMQYWITLDAPRNIWVKSADVNVELGLSEGFRIEYVDHSLLFGEVHVLRGKAEVIGRRFDLQKDSQLRFAGAAKSPYINLVAVHQNDREGVTVFVTLTGRGKEVALKTSSKPPMPESEIFTLLATGRRTLKRGSGSTMTGAQAASVMGGYLASQLKGALAKKLPLDVVSVQAGEEGLVGTRVEAGTYLSDQVYLGYELQLGADHQKGQNSNAGKLEYLISRFWTFEATAGDARAGGAELVWRQEF